MDNHFEMVIRKAQQNDSDATMELLNLLRPRLLHYSKLNDVHDEDLMQYLIVRFLIAIKDFKL
ncbi:MAG: helix-turn-helix domain-containing protein [Clostridia bacterium]